MYMKAEGDNRERFINSLKGTYCEQYELANGVKRVKTSIIFQAKVPVPFR